MGLISETVEILVGHRKNYWINLGYNIPQYRDDHYRMKVKLGEKIIVKATDLPDGSHVKVKVMCDFCKIPIDITWRDYLQRVRDDGSYYCKKCNNSKCLPEELSTRQSKRHTNDIVREVIKNAGLDWYAGKYISSGENTLCCVDSQGYKYLTSYNVIKAGGCANNIVHPKNPFSIENIELWLCKNNQNIKWMEDIYIDNKYNHIWQCLKCNSPFKSQWNKIISGAGCPFCAGRQVNHTNSIRSLRPDLIKYFKNESDVDKYTPNSSQKVQLVCPECQCEKSKLTVIHSLSKGFSCDICSDGISIPEKFGIYLLKQLDINFETQKIFSWAKNKKYDFYIPSQNMIIETHGIQHYEETSGVFQSLSSQQANDAEKYTIAINKNINKYIIVDGRYSRFEWLKNNYEIQLSPYYDLTRVDWNTVWENCQSSLKVKVWETWSNRDSNDSTTMIEKRFNLSKCTIIKYLKDGVAIGKCEYDAKSELSRRSFNVGKANVKKIHQYTIDGIFVREWDSLTEAHIELGIDNSSISMCCKGKRKTAKGFVFKYA